MESSDFETITTYRGSLIQHQYCVSRAFWSLLCVLGWFAASLYRQLIQTDSQRYWVIFNVLSVEFYSSYFQSSGMR